MIFQRFFLLIFIAVVLFNYPVIFVRAAEQAGGDGKSTADGVTTCSAAVPCTDASKSCNGGGFCQAKSEQTSDKPVEIGKLKTDLNDANDGVDAAQLKYNAASDAYKKAYATDKNTSDADVKAAQKDLSAAKAKQGDAQEAYSDAKGDDKNDKAATERAKERRAAKGDPCANGIVANDEGVAHVSRQCSGDKRAIENIDKVGTAMEAVGQSAAEIVGKAAEASAAKDGNDQRKILRDSGRAQENQGITQMTLGGTNLVFAGAAYIKTFGHGNYEELADQASTMEAMNDKQYSDHCGARCANMTPNKLHRAKEEELEMIGLAADKHSEVNSSGLGTAMVNMLAAAKNMAGGAMTMETGLQNIEAANKMHTPGPSGPQLTPLQASDTQPTTPAAPNQVVNPVPLGGDLAATANPTSTPDKTSTPDHVIPAGGGSPPTAGGLKDSPIPSTAGQLGAPTTTAGAAGAGAAGGGGGGVPEAATAGNGGDAPESNGVNFAGPGGGPAAGGAGYAGGGGGSKRGDGGTGMDLNGLLSQFLPQNKEEDGRKPASSILDYGTAKNGQGGKGRGQNGDDGSVMGKDAILFPRISTVLTVKYQKGELLRK